MSASDSAEHHPKTEHVNARARLRILLRALLVVALLVGGTWWALAHVGRWLVVQDSLARAQAIVVLSGHMPYRALEAAELYRQGFAREIWLTRATGGEEIMKELGIPYVTEEEYNRMVLEKLGVASTSVHVLPQAIVNTAQEIVVISSELRRSGGQRVILVTSPPHTRRVRTIWQRLVGPSPQAIVRYAPQDSFDADHWWRTTPDALSVVREVLGLMNAWAGFPVGR